jgi:hypothetical protein
MIDVAEMARGAADAVEGAMVGAAGCSHPFPREGEGFYR